MEDDKFDYYMGLGKALVAACFECYTGKIKLKEIETNYQMYAAVLIKDSSGIGFQKLCSQINLDKNSLNQALSSNPSNIKKRDKPLKYCFKYLDEVSGGYEMLGEFIETRTLADDNIETILEQLNFVGKI